MPDTEHIDCDVLVVGAGPAGIAAAVSAAAHGCRVVVVDDNAAPGGQIWRGQHDDTADKLARKWIEKLSTRSVEQHYGVRVLGSLASGVLLAESSAGIRELHFRKLVLTTGARERFLPFPGWTLPNVLGAGGLQALAKSGLPLKGRRIVVAGSGPLLLAVAAAFQKYGAVIVTICEQAPWKQLLRFGLALTSSPTKTLQALQYKNVLRNVSYRIGWWPVEAHGSMCLESVVVSNGKTQKTFDCDYLACGFHLVPNAELAALLGCDTTKTGVTVDAFQQTSCQDIFCAGEPTGIGGVELAIIEGEVAGLAAANEPARAQSLFSRRERMRKFSNLLNASFTLREELKLLACRETIVCRCEDISYGQLASQTSWRQAKLHTRCGMGPCQGRVCGAATEFLFGWPMDSVRLPVSPTRYQTLMQSTTQHQTELQEP